MLYVNPEHTVRAAIDIMRANGVSQLPVCKNTPPFAAAEVSGSVDELELMEAIARDPSVMETAVEEVMGPPLPTIGAGQRLELALQMLHTAPALLVLSGGRPLSVLTRTDILSFFEARARRLSARRMRAAMGEEQTQSGWAFETLAIHAGQPPDAATGAVVPPISLATTFAQREVGVHQGYEYSRSGNPTRTAVEQQVAALEVGPPRAGVRQRTGRRGQRAAAARVRASACCSATTPTAARSG